MGLRKFQDRYGLNNRQVAEMIGCSLPTIQKWRAGDVAVSPAADRLMRLLDCLARGRVGVLSQVLRGINLDLSSFPTGQEASCDHPLVGGASGWDAGVQTETRPLGAASLSDQRFRLMVESQSEAVCRWSPDGAITYANRAFCALFKRKRAVLIGSSLIDLFMEEDRESLRKVFPVILRRGVQSRHSHQVIDGDGDIHTIEWIFTPVRDPDGQVREWQAVGHDITAEIQRKREMLDRLRMETLVADISKRFIRISPDTLDEEIDHCLSRFGIQTGADRVYLFQLTEDLAEISNTHEWCAEGIEPQKALLQDLPVGEVEWWMGEMSAGRTINFYNIDQMPAEASSEHAMLQAQGIHSILVIPIVSHTRLLGFLGFDSVAHRRVWQSSEVSLLTVASDIFAKALEGIHLQRREAHEIRFREMAMSCAKLGTWSWRLKENRVHCCVRVSGILGWDPEALDDVPSDTWLRMIHPDDAGVVAVLTRRLIRGTTSGIDLEMRVRCGNGVFKWCAVRGEVFERSSEGEPLVLAGAIWDISERKAAEHQLSLSSDFHQTILRNFPVIVWRTNSRGLREYFNEAFVDFSGKPLGELENGGWIRCLHADDRDGYLSVFAKSFQNRSPFTRLFRMENGEGKYRWMREISKPITDGDGAFEGFVGTLFDVTEECSAVGALHGLANRMIDYRAE